MNESVRTAASDGEAPVNPYSLLEAVNSSSDTAHTGWLIFIGTMSYLLVAVAGVTHKDLLLSRDIALPLLQVNIELTRFFLFAPILLVLFHLGIVSQLVMLARKALEFDTAIRMLEVSDKRTHPLRLELSNFFFVQAIAGPERSPVMSFFLHAMSWLTLILLPVFVLLYVQVAFLPYHDVMITWAHRIALTADIGMLVLIGVFLLRPEPSFVSAVGHTTRRHPFSFGITLLVLALVSMVSFLVATVPDEPLDRAARMLTGAAVRPGSGSDVQPSVLAETFLKASADGALFGLFQRNLNVADVDFVVDKDVTPDEPSIVLRNRDLRNARLDRADLHQADLTGANLDGASLIGADLRKVFLQCADLNRLVLSENRQAANCSSARNANLTRARLREARMAGLDLTGARLDEADLEAADLNYALLADSSFYGARLQRADLTGGVAAQRVNFAAASLQGADLTGARLAGADFTSAGLQGAILVHANLNEAMLRDADLEAADLAYARLQGASFGGARLRAASLRGAAIWMTSPPDREFSLLADLSEIVPAPLDGSDGGRTAPAPVLVSASTKAWADGADQQAWQSLGSSTATGLVDNYKIRLTDYLVQLACKPRWADGSVATGVVRRALAPDFKGDMPVIHDRLKADTCPAAKAVAAPLMRRLATAADVARGQ